MIILDKYKPIILFKHIVYMKSRLGGGNRALHVSASPPAPSAPRPTLPRQLAHFLLNVKGCILILKKLSFFCCCRFFSRTKIFKDMRKLLRIFIVSSISLSLCFYVYLCLYIIVSLLRISVSLSTLT